MSGAATMRNAVKRITHKERSQPNARKKFGLLEKHKDYQKRAFDFHKKEKYLKSLKKKAAERNPGSTHFFIPFTSRFVLSFTLFLLPISSW